MAPFVWSMMGEDAGEQLAHIIARKESERQSGSGQFWWGLGTPLGEDVEKQAIANGGTLPVLFSKPRKTQPINSNLQVRVWNKWRSISGQNRGSIPTHVLITSSYNPTTPKKPHYALVCHSDTPLSLGKCGFVDRTQCLTVRNRITPGPSQRTALLTRQTAHKQGYEVAFEASLTSPWYVRLVEHRVLSDREIEDHLRLRARRRLGRFGKKFAE